MKHTLLAVLMSALTSGLLMSASYAAPATPFTPEAFAQEMAKLPVGNATKGKEAHTQLMCNGCHGPQGIAMMGDFPHVSGQPAKVTAKSLLDYRAGRRATGGQAPMMAGMAGRLTDQNIADLAAYYETLPGGKGVEAKKDDKTKDANAPATISKEALHRLITKGDASRGITPCAACHGTKARGNPNGEVPVLQGQNPAYLKATLKAYRAGDRHSDLLKEMRYFAKALTDEEIEALGSYYGEKKGRKGDAPQAPKSDKP